MIPSHPDILSGIVHSTALTDKDISGFHYLVSEFLETQSFAM